MTFHIFHGHRVCLVDSVDLTCSLYNWWEGFGSSFSATLPLFQLWFYVRLYMWMVHWGLLLRLPWRPWVCPCEARCGGGAAAWVTGVHAAPGSQGGWRLGQQQTQRSRRVWQPALANTLQCSCLENPHSLTEKPGRPQSTGSQSWT